ncbi:unnamed protein product [Aphanomyces euteiches]
MVPFIFVVNCLVFLASVFVGCYVYASHAKQIFNPPAQIISIRFALFFILTAACFFLQFLSTEISTPDSTASIVHDMIEEIVTGVVEAIMLFSFFFLLVVHVGGTDRMILLFAQFHMGRSRSATTVTTPELTTPDPNDKPRDKTEDYYVVGVGEYYQYRQMLFMFCVVRPLVSLAMVINRYYNVWILRVLLATINIFVTVAAVVVLMLTIRRLLPVLNSGYRVVAKFFVVKGLLLVRSFQWAVYCILVEHHDDTAVLRVYYTACGVECLLFCVVFAYAFHPKTFTSVNTFPGLSFTRVWDVTMHPVPDCLGLAPSEQKAKLRMQV